MCDYCFCTPTWEANVRNSLHSYSDQLMRMGTRQGERDQEVLDIGLGQKRTTLTRYREGADMLAFIFFPLLHHSLSEQPSSVRSRGVRRAQWTLTLQRSQQAADTHQFKSPPAMTWYHLISDLYCLMPNISHAFQMSSNEVYCRAFNWFVPTSIDITFVIGLFCPFMFRTWSDLSPLYDQKYSRSSSD